MRRAFVIAGTVFCYFVSSPASFAQIKLNAPQKLTKDQLIGMFRLLGELGEAEDMCDLRADKNGLSRWTSRVDFSVLGDSPDRVFEIIGAFSDYRSKNTSSKADHCAYMVQRYGPQGNVYPGLLKGSGKPNDN